MHNSLINSKYSSKQQLYKRVTVVCFYICFMRLLLSILATALFFIAPLKSNAAEKPVHSITAAGKASSKASFIAHLTDLDLTAVSSKSTQSNGNSLRCKTFSITNFITPVYFINSTIIVDEKKHFVPDYAAHIPIALKLLFPEHYFW